MFLKKDEIEGFDKLKKVQLATSLPGVKATCLVGSIDRKGNQNLSIFSTITHFGSSPLLLGMVTRPDTVERHTLSNILETEQWTLSHVTSDIVEAAHQCSAKYPRTASEFEATGLTPFFAEKFIAPAVAESPVKIGLSLDSIIDIPTNGTKLILGKVEWLSIDDEALKHDGSIDFERSGTLGSTALDTYFQVSELCRLPYAKP